MSRLLFDAFDVLAESLSDSITVADSTVFSHTLAISDSASFADAQSLSALQYLALVDTATFVDATTFSQTRALTDTTTLADATTFSQVKALTDITTLVDVAAIALSDSVTIADGGQAFSRTLTLSDTAAFGDSLVDSGTEVLSDSIVVSDFINVTPMVPVVTPPDAGSGPVTGGKLLAVVGAGVDMFSLEDRFTDGNIDPALWTSAVTGSGVITELPGARRGVLQLSTGLTGSSTAYLRSVDTSDRSDAEIEVATALLLRTSNSQTVVSLGAYASSTTYLRASVEAMRSASTLHIQAVQNGLAVQDISIPLRTSSVKKFKLRLLRDQGTFYVFMNGALIATSRWATVDASVEFGVLNDLTGTASIKVSVSKYVRNPVVLFGSKVMTTILSKSVNRIDGLAPAQSRPGPQIIHVYTSDSSFDLADPYLYLPTIAFRRVGIAGSTTLRDVSDTSVRA